MDIHNVYKILLPYFRKCRMRRFIETFLLSSSTRILDVGGTPYNWNAINCEAQITLLNLSIPNNSKTYKKTIRYVQGDGLNLEYSNEAFDICCSNSVIEHLGSFENQMRFAKEISRVARKIWIQTPAKNFFFEPHLITPFIHYFPKQLQRKLLRNFTVWGWLTRPSSNEVDKFLSNVRLLSYSEMKKLFPDCEIRKERFLEFSKSFIVVRK